MFSQSGFLVGLIMGDEDEKESVKKISSSKKSSEGAISSFPDVSETPAPSSGPVPVPYPNIAKSSNTSSGTKKVKIEGKEVSTKKSSFSKSTGNEASTKKREIIEAVTPKVTKVTKNHPTLVIVLSAPLSFLLFGFYFKLSPKRLNLSSPHKNALCLEYLPYSTYDEKQRSARANPTTNHIPHIFDDK